MEKKSLTFGKHRNKPIQEVPTDYLEWVTDASHTQWNPPAEAVQLAKDELAKRNPPALDEITQLLWETIQANQTQTMNWGQIVETMEKHGIPEMQAATRLEELLNRNMVTEPLLGDIRVVSENY